MLFFTQCFGAVLDLIHLRFQHYKAKRVFSAAGQLVCVVNPTHNLKVSCSPSFYTQILSRGSESRPPACVWGHWQSSSLALGWCLVPGAAAQAGPSSPGGLVFTVTAVSPTGKNNWSDSPVSFPQTVNLRMEPGSSEGGRGSRVRPPSFSHIFVGQCSGDRIEKLPTLQSVPCVWRGRQARGFWKPLLAAA